MSVRGLSRRSTLKLLGASSLALSAPAFSRVAQSAHVVVIGAGFSGLYAAMLLEGEGVKVTVLEGDTRVGGRARTMYDLPGQPEAGAKEIGGMYARVVSIADELSVSLTNPIEMDSENVNLGGIKMAISLDGNLIDDEQWATSPHNTLPPLERRLPPNALLWSSMAKDNPIEDLETWLDPSIQEQYDMPLSDYLNSTGISATAQRILANDAYKEDLSQISALDVLRLVKVFEFYQRQDSTNLHIDGGTSKLPEAMANSLKGDVLLNKKVVAISQDTTGVKVSCGDGTTHDGTHIVCSIPFSVLRTVEIDPQPPALQKQAIDRLPYSEAMVIFFTAAPYWEDDGLAPNTWTDGPLGLIQYLPYHGGTFWSFSNGNASRWLDGLTHEESNQAILAELTRVRPSTQGRIEVTGLHSWTSHPFSLGQYKYFAPGQIRRFADKMARPFDRVHFAGEHTAILNIGLESAMESGERAAIDILGQI